MDDTAKLTSLQKALAELNSYVNVVRGATHPGKNVEDSAKLLKFLQDNYKSLLKQHDELALKIREANPVVAEVEASSEESTNE